MLKLHIPVCTETRISLSGDDCCKIILVINLSLSLCVYVLMV